MSQQFSDTTTHKGIIQGIERAIYGFDGVGRISGNSTLLKQWTAEINNAWDDYIRLAFKASGTRQFDDSNHTDYPFIEADLTANERNYTFLSDENGNLILDVYKVMLKNPDGVYFELDPIDQQSRGEGVSIWDGQAITGVPKEYDKTGNGIILDVLPNYSWRNGTEGEYGIKMFINREASYFTSSDTTKKPGCMGTHHRYFVVKPAYNYAKLNGLASTQALYDEVLGFEGNEETGIIGSIERDYSRRNRDEKKVIKMKRINYI